MANLRHNVLGLLLLIAGSRGFYQYDVDCDIGCRRETLPCTIAELSPEQFPCDCITDTDSCKEKAAPRTVCILPNGLTFGGRESWIDYFNYTHRGPTTTPAPAPSPPSPVHDTPYLLLYSTVVTTVLLIYGGTGLFRCLAQTWRRRQYQRLGINQPSSAAASNTPNTVYAPTTQDV